MNLKISIVIPNWNGSSLLLKHLPAVLAASKGSEIVVIDDASSDESVAEVRRNFPDVRIISKKKHEGFAGTVNEGVRRATGDIVVLLNTDIVPEKNFLNPLVEHFHDPKVFAAGCMDKSVEGDTVILRGRGVGEWEKGFYVHKRGEVDKTDTDWVSGGSGAFRKSVWLELGGMDTIFKPFYWEDIDLSYRAKRLGYRLVFEPKSTVIHKHEEGKIMESYSKNYIRSVSFRNQLLFCWKNIGNADIFLSHLFYVPVRLLQALFSGDMPMVLGFFMALGYLPEIVHNRRRHH